MGDSKRIVICRCELHVRTFGFSGCAANRFRDYPASTFVGAIFLRETSCCRQRDLHSGMMRAAGCVALRSLNSFPEPASRGPLFPSLAVGPGRPAPGLKPDRQRIFPCASRRIPRAAKFIAGQVLHFVAPLTGSGPAQAVLSVRRRREQGVPGRQPRKRKGDPHGKRTRIRH